MLDDIMLTDFKGHTWDSETHYVCVPSAPKTRKAAKELQEQINELLAEGRVFEACPWQCQIAMFSIVVLGEEHPDTLRAVVTVTMALSRRDMQAMALCGWALPRAARLWGLGHPDTRQLALLGARQLCISMDPSEHPEFTRLVTNVCRHLPGELGWGSTVVAPVPDEEGYNRHAALLVTAEDKVKEEPKLAKRMAERCVAYFASMGTHWLGCVRKGAARRLVASCVAELEGYAAAEPLFAETKRMTQKELGAEHMETLEVVWKYGESLMYSGRVEAALSLFQKTLRVRQRIFGAGHTYVFQSQVHMAQSLIKANKRKEAEDMLLDVIDNVIKSLGPHEQICGQAARMCWHIMHWQGRERRRDAIAMRVRLARLGCDVSECKYDARLHGQGQQKR